jgi:hypothetical protein
LLTTTTSQRHSPRLGLYTARVRAGAAGKSIDTAAVISEAAGREYAEQIAPSHNARLCAIAQPPYDRQTFYREDFIMKTNLPLIIGACLTAGAVLFAAEPATPKEETKPSGLKVTYVTAGSGAKDGDTVSVLYTGKLKDGTVFDASDKHGGDPIEFVLGKGMVIKGWDEGVAGMQVGEKRVLVIPPNLGYGERGAGGVIPPNATLTFDVTLVGLRRPPEPK